MARKIVVTGRFNGDFPYKDDRGVERQIATRFNAPDHFEDADVNALAGILLAGGSQPFKVNGTVINAIGDTPCPETDNIKPRRMRFIFQDNSSLSVPLNKDPIAPVDVANQILTNINGATDVPVVCIEYIGEEIVDILGEFDSNFQGSPLLPSPANKYYAGQATYQDDVLNKQYLLPFKVLSENAPDNPPSNIAQAWNECVGSLQQNNFSCGSSSRRYEHRRLIPQFVVNDFLGEANDENLPASHEIPILNRASTGAGSIQACAESIVDTLDGSIYCLAYRGHSDRRFHLNNDVNLES